MVDLCESVANNKKMYRTIYCLKGLLKNSMTFCDFFPILMLLILYIHVHINLLA